MDKQAFLASWSTICPAKSASQRWETKPCSLLCDLDKQQLHGLAYSLKKVNFLVNPTR
jgi:hypothetical protein